MSLLVLARKIGERVWIDGGRIKVVVLEIDRNVVRLGFEADRSIPIMREELVEADDKGE